MFSTFVLLFSHYLFVSRNTHEWFLIIVFSLIGFACDSILGLFGFINFLNPLILTVGSEKLVLAPLWLLMLWVSVATCLGHCLSYLHGRWLWVFLVIIFFVPINYYIGGKLRGATFYQPIFYPLIVLVFYWAFLLPVGLLWSKKINEVFSCP